MKLTDILDFTADASKEERTLDLTLRVGLDFSVAAYGFLNDWVFPFMFVPSLRGIYLQVLGLGLFIGRFKETAK